MAHRSYRGGALVIGLAACWSLLPSPASAYIDPGTTGMLLQLLFGGIAGGLVVVRLYWSRIRVTSRRLFGAQRPADDSGGGDQK